MPEIKSTREGLSPEPFWYKSGVIYELHVRGFFDADEDGTGDFRGLTQKLDYIRDLGVTAIWLLPFYPSPLKDDGYDIAEYCAVHPMYGNLGDFKKFLREAHKRGLRVITELVLNHTSDQHPWFQRARRAKPGSRWRNFYVWSDTPDKYKDAPIIFQGVESSNWTLDPVAGAYFWHRFFYHQPDLNYDNPEVHEAMFKVVDFWFDMGVDGMRLDAVPYLYERDGTSCENLPETHAFLKSLRAHVDEKYSDRMLLAEANLWPEDAVSYFGAGRGDECHMAFHFPLMPRLFMALRMEDRLPIVEILEQTPAIPETSQWALFLRNHDELTLSTVTDEERDYMYRMYAQLHQAQLYLGIRRRLAPLLGNDRKSIELLNALLFSLPGTPVLYYGDEIGLGDNIYLGDRNGVRTPMQWSSDKNAGFSRANPQKLYLPIIHDPAYHYEANNVEAELDNPHSLLWWMRRLLALRKRWRALGEGKCEFLSPENHKILSYVLRHENETILVVANLSRFAQPVELDLSAYVDLVPVELFGRMKFPVIGGAPYLLTLGPHNFYWFLLQPKPEPLAPKTEGGVALPSIAVSDDWRDIFSGKPRIRFEAVLPDFLRASSHFSMQNKSIKLVTVREHIDVPLAPDNKAAIIFLQVEFMDANAELYALPVVAVTGETAERLRKSGIAELVLAGGGRALLCDGFADPAFTRALFELMRRRERLFTEHAELQASCTGVLRQNRDGAALPDPTVKVTRDGNTIAIFGDQYVLKFFHRLWPGTNPELEIGRVLGEKHYAHFAPLLGALEYHDNAPRATTLAVAKAFVPQTVNAWDYILDSISRYYDRVFADAAQGHEPPSTPEETASYIGMSLESARLLGKRSAELHLMLASASDDGDFCAVPVTRQYMRSVFQSMRSVAIQNLRLLKKLAREIPADLAPVVKRVADLEPVIIDRYRELVNQDFDAARIRTHGDFHLGQALWTGIDFVFLDFEGDTTIPISERRIKRSPLADVARMARSFHHAAYAGFWRQLERGANATADFPKFEPWVRHWNRAVIVAFLQAYCQALRDSGLLPRDEEKLRKMLIAYLLNQVMDELGEELLRHSDKVRAPLQAVIHLTEEKALQQFHSEPTAKELRPVSTT